MASKNSEDTRSEDQIDFAPNDHQYFIRDVIIVILSSILFISDWVTDILTAVNYYINGDTAWFQLTLIFVVCPSIIMMIVSFYWYLTDRDSQVIPRKMWIFRIVMLICQLGPIARYFEGMIYGLKSRKAWKEGDRRNQVKYYRLMLKEDSDACLSNMAQCFMESAPQLIIQLYILLDITMDGDRTTYRGIWFYLLWVSCGTSIISLSWSVTAATRTNRFIDETKYNISFIGTFIIMVWQCLVIASRIISIILFAKMFTYWIFVFGACHWVLMFFGIIGRRSLKPAFPECFSCETAFSMILAGVYNFAYVNDKEELTRVKYAMFHSVFLVEHIAITVLWYYFGNPALWYHSVGLVIPITFHILGIIFMCVYYGCFHPSKLPIKMSCHSKSVTEPDGGMSLVQKV